MYCGFISPFKSKCRLNYKLSHFIICPVLVLIFIGPGLVWKISSDLDYYWVPVLVGSAYSVNVLFSMVTLMSIYKNQFELTVKDEGCYGEDRILKFVRDWKTRLQNAKATDSEFKDEKAKVRCSSVDETSSGEIQKKSMNMDCEICLQKFDASIESRIPRILINCGHTMCQECIQRLLTDNHKIISCPFCQKATTVKKGKAENLPKNFAIFKMIR